MDFFNSISIGAAEREIESLRLRIEQIEYYLRSTSEEFQQQWLKQKMGEKCK